jgi:WD40 repeat protein
MSDAISCPKCQRRLRLPEGTAGEEIECPLCGGSFPHPGEAADSEIDSAMACTPPDRERPGRNPIRKRLSSGWLIVLAGGGVLLVALFCTALGGYVYWSRKHDATAKPAPEWKTFTAPDGSFSIEMPGTPVRTPMNDGSGGIKYLYEDRKADLIYAVAYIDLPDHRPVQIGKLALAERDELLKKLPGARLDSEHDLPDVPYPGHEIRIKPPSGQGILIDRVLLVATRTKWGVYVIVVGGPHIVADAGDAARFFNSFKPSDTAEPEKKPPTDSGKNPAQYILGPSGPDEVNNIKPHPEGTVDGFCFSPAGDSLVTEGSDGKLKQWDLPDFRLKAEIPALAQETRSFAWSRDGRTLALSNSNRVSVHDGATGAQRFTFAVQRIVYANDAPDVMAMTFSPDGATLAVGLRARGGPSERGEIHFWDMASKKEIHAMRANPDGVNCLAFSPDGHTLASSGGKQIILWDADTRGERLALDGHTGTILALAFSPDGKTIASGSHDRTLRVWDAASGKTRYVVELTGSDVTSLSFDPASKSLASTGFGGELMIYDLETGRPRIVLGGRLSNGQSEIVGYSPDGKYLALTQGGRKTIKVLDAVKLRNRPPETFFSKSTEPDAVGDLNAPAERIWFHGDGKTAATFSASHELRLWDLPNFTLRTLIGPDPGELRGVSCSRDGSKFAVAATFFVYLRSGTTAKLERTFTITHPSSDKQAETSAVALTPDGNGFAVGVMDRLDRKKNTIQLWDVVEGKSITTILDVPSELNELLFSPDGQRLLARGSEWGIRTWDVATRKEGPRFVGHWNALRGMAVSPDSQTVVTWSQDLTLRTFEAATGRTKFFIESDVTRAAFSPDGKLIAAAARGGEVRLYDSQTGDFRGQFRPNPGRNWSDLAFSPDGQWLAASSDGGAKVWQVARGLNRPAEQPANLSSPATKPEEVVNLNGQSGGVRALAFAPEGNGLCISSNAYAPLRLWGGENGQLARELWANSQSVVAISYSKDGKTIAAGQENGYVTLRDATTGRLLDVFQVRQVKGRIAFLRDLSFSPDGKRLAISLQTAEGIPANGELHLWNLGERKLVGVIDFKVAPNRVLYLPDGSALVTAAGAEVKFWNPETRQEMYASPGHTSVVLSLETTANGDRIVTGGDDQLIKVWDAKNGTLLQTIKGNNVSVRHVAWSPDGKLLVSRGEGQFNVWDAESGKKRAVIALPPKTPAGPVAFRADGKALAGGAGETVKLWDVDKVLANLAPK